MKLSDFLIATALTSVAYFAHANPSEILQKTIKDIKTDSGPKPAATITASKTPAKILGEAEIEKIPFSEGEDEKGRPDQEAKDFAKNWKGKTVSIRGKVNRGGGISLRGGEIYISGCESALRGLKLNAQAVVTGVLDYYSTGGSGGMPMGLTNCRLYEENTSGGVVTEQTVMPPSGSPNSAAAAAAPDTSEVNLGYLKKNLKTFEDAGCAYILSQDDKKNGNADNVAADDFQYKGIVLNINGQDVLVKGSRGKAGFKGSFNDYLVVIPPGKQRNCGEECSKELTTIVITKGSYKKTVPVVGYCGS